MLALFLLLTGCQPAADAISARIIASPDFEAAVSAAVAKKMAETKGDNASGGDMTAMKGMAKCLANVKKAYSGASHFAGRKSVKQCGRIGLGEEPPQ